MASGRGAYHAAARPAAEHAHPEPRVPPPRGCGTSPLSSAPEDEMKSVDVGRVRSLAESFGTPCYVYDAEVIRERIRSLAAFDVVRYAQKACSNLHILKLMRDQGALVDAVSLGEIERALRAGF